MFLIVQWTFTLIKVVRIELSTNDENSGMIIKKNKRKEKNHKIFFKLVINPNKILKRPRYL